MNQSLVIGLVLFCVGYLMSAIFRDSGSLLELVSYISTLIGLILIVICLINIKRNQRKPENRVIILREEIIDAKARVRKAEKDVIDAEDALELFYEKHPEFRNYKIGDSDE